MHVQIHAIADQQFAVRTIGSKIRTSGPAFSTSILEPLIRRFEEHCQLADVASPSPDLQKMWDSGQYRLDIPEAQVSDLFSCGIGRHTHNADDYIVRKWRDHVQLFLKRGHAAPVESASAIVYTRAAIKADPETTPELLAWLKPETTHVLVTCLAVGGPTSPPPTLDRWARNLAGANNAYSPENLAAYLLTHTYEADVAKRLNDEDLFGAAVMTTAMHIQEEATGVLMYADEWCVVAD